MPRTKSILRCCNCKRDLPRDAFQPKEWRGKIVGVKPSCRECCENWIQRKRQRAIDSAAAPFWSKVDRSGGPNACWPWMGNRSPGGYGRITIRRANGTRDSVRANRYAIELIYGPIPEGMFACHACDNPPCCNPAHLFVGLPADNTHDAQQKGRIPKKFTDDEIRDIRARYIPRKVSYASLAREYDVSMSTIRDVVKRYIAKHVE